MKQSFYQTLIAIIVLLASAFAANAQTGEPTEINIDNVKIVVSEKKTDTASKKKRKGLEGMEISIGNNGISVRDPKKKKKHKKLHTGMHFDFGINNFVDNTTYANSNIVNFSQLVQTDSSYRNLTKSDLKLRNAKSVNFNFWPVWLKQDIARHNVQIETGLGFQFFNYQFDSKVRHNNSYPNDLTAITPQFEEITDPTRLTGKEKNKFGVSYVSVPLMLRFNSNKKKGHRYFFGAGVIGSYKLKSWTKFYGEKESGDYGINDWMTQVTAELGVTGIIKLYGTYSLQSMYNSGGQNSFDRRPFAIGIRL